MFGAVTVCSELFLAKLLLLQPFVVIENVGLYLFVLNTKFKNLPSSVIWQVVHEYKISCIFRYTVFHISP